MITEEAEEIKLVKIDPQNKYSGWYVIHPEDPEWNETQENDIVPEQENDNTSN